MTGIGNFTKTLTATDGNPSKTKVFFSGVSNVKIRSAGAGGSVFIGF